jgi:Mannosyltransferase (PIG-V)
MRAVDPEPSAVPALTRRIGELATAVARALTRAIPADVLAVLVASRVALALVGLLSMHLLAGPETVLYPATGIDVIDVWTRWDGPFYVQIAAHGYDPDSALPNIVFFPLYPALISVVGALGWGGIGALWVAALVVSFAALVAAVAYLVALARIELGHGAARRAAVYLLVFPTTLFLTAAYPESLFLALSVGSFYHARRGQWWVAALLGFAASLARPYGALLVVPLALEYLLQRRFDLRLVRRDVLWLGIVPLGLVAFLAYIASRFGAEAMGTAQQIWGRGFVPPWEVALRIFDGPVVLHGMTVGVSVVDLVFAAFLLIMVVVAWRRLRPTYALHATVLLATILSSGAFTSVPRYGLAIFPVYLLLGAWAHRSARHEAIVTVSAILAGLAMALFASGSWVA